MNRIALQEFTESTDRAFESAAARFEDTRASQTTFDTFVPLHYEKNYAYPLVVWMHDASETEEQVRSVMPELSLRNYVAVAPRGTLTARTSSVRHCSWDHSPEGIVRACESVTYCIQRARSRYHIADNRIFVAGSGQGGTMALRLALANPEVFAAAATLNGPFPTGNMPLCEIRAARDLPLFVAQGRASSAYTEDRFCNDLRLLHSAGMSLMLRQYPGRDDVTGDMLRDLNAWFMSIVTGEEWSVTSTEGVGKRTGHYNQDDGWN